MHGFVAVPFNFFFFGVYESVMWCFCRVRSCSRQDIGVLGTILAGGTTGALSWGAIFPMDVVKSKMQTEHGATPRSVAAVTTDVWRTHGIGGFYRGCRLSGSLCDGVPPETGPGRAERDMLQDEQYGGHLAVFCSDALRHCRVAVTERTLTDRPLPLRSLSWLACCLCVLLFCAWARGVPLQHRNAARDPCKCSAVGRVREQPEAPRSV